LANGDAGRAFRYNLDMLQINALQTAHLTATDAVIASGECVAVMGPSGSGKTLFLRAIADLDPGTGRVTLDGVERQSLAAPQWRQKVCYLPPDSGWWADDVAAHFPDSQAARTLFPRLGLPVAALDWEVARLSTGERQRLALARALLLHPAVLLLDEPTSGLDATAMAAVEAVLKGALDEGAAIILVTHDAAQGKRMAKRCLHFNQGRLESEEQWART